MLPCFTANGFYQRTSLCRIIITNVWALEKRLKICEIKSRTEWSLERVLIYRLLWKDTLCNGHLWAGMTIHVSYTWICGVDMKAYDEVYAAEVESGEFEIF